MKISFPLWLRFFVAGLLCIMASYFTEPTLGAVATIPFIIIFPAIAYLIYRKALHITLLCALGGFVFKALTAPELSEAIPFAIECALFAAVTVIVMKYTVFGKITKKHVGILAFSAFFVVSVIIYALLHGTFYGNLTSKETNAEFMSEVYPDIEFTIGSTYYSTRDGRYLTEAVFRDKEVYSARFSAPTDKDKAIDGYRDYCEARLLEYGTVILENYLSSFAHEGEDYALRRDRINTSDRLTAGASPEQYYADMCYEIAFYDVFASSDDFEKKCSEYAEYLPKSFDYSEITFFGFGENGDSFEYSLRLSKSSGALEAVPFDESSFMRYNTDEDTHKYWSVIK